MLKRPISLKQWYQAHGRKELPWRETSDPYTIWLSEVMLQQTQVATVLPYYARFLEAYPTVKALAKAPEQEVLKLWQGLGYYQRARNLHRAAKQVVAQHSGIFPDTYDALIALPGIGQNTAHAILSFAYHKPYPVMEANVKRVLCRLYAIRTPKIPQLWEKAAALIEGQDPFIHNQAMMDIGAMICTPKAPKCCECPLYTLCKGRKTPEHYPTKIAKKKPPIRTATLVLYTKEKKIWVTKRTTRFLHGLYGFAEVKTAPKAATSLGNIRNTYSHFTLNADVHHIHNPKHVPTGGTWVSFHDISKLPLSRADEKAWALLDASLRVY